MANTYISETLSGAQFSDGSVLNGSWLAEYDANGNLIAIVNSSFTLTPTSGSAITYSTDKLVNTTSTSPYEINVTGSTNTTNYSKLYVAWNGESPTALAPGTSIQSAAAGSTPLTLTNNGSVASTTDTAVTTTINNASFVDGSTLSGTWTAIYDSSGNLLAVQNATFTVTGSSGTTTFTNAGTLPYANSTSNTSYEMRFGTVTNSANTTTGYTSLYVDWKSENPSSFYEGSPSLYTSVVSNGSSPIRLASDGTSGTGTTPNISSLSSTETGSDNAAMIPFSSVTVSDSDNTSATITLNNSSGVATDADGTLSGTGLTRTGTGTYALAATTPAALTTELQALKFTPTAGQTNPGNTVATRIDLAVNDTDGSVTASTTATVTAVCFLRGSMIATPDGEVAVETLRAGDLVTVLDQGAKMTRPVRWVGRGAITAAQTDASDQAFPIRIRAGAISDGVPHRDLLVTPEHCILTEVGLVPARMLVNGASILIDRALGAYDYFHVELDTHGILVAEGLSAESYLDTGNRSLFAAIPGDVSALRTDPTMGMKLAVTRDLVEPIWVVLAERAERELGLPLPGRPDTSAPEIFDLRLLLDDGRQLTAVAHDHARHMFHIPRNARPIRLLSQASVPAELIGPFIDDRRCLGVAVDRLIHWIGLDGTVIPAADLDLSGWHALEGTYRWTDGNATLDLPVAADETFLDIHLVATMASHRTVMAVAA